VLSLNQEAVIDISLRLAPSRETFQVTRRVAHPQYDERGRSVSGFDQTKVAELPVSNTRDVFSLALQVWGEPAQTRASRTSPAAPTSR